MKEKDWSKAQDHIEPAVGGCNETLWSETKGPGLLPGTRQVSPRDLQNYESQGEEISFAAGEETTTPGG